MTIRSSSLKRRPRGERLLEVGRAETLLGGGFREDGDSLVGPARDLLVGEEVGQDDVRDLVGQDRLDQVGMVGAEVDPAGDDPARVQPHRRETGRILGLTGHPVEDRRRG